MGSFEKALELRKLFFFNSGKMSDPWNQKLFYLLKLDPSVLIKNMIFNIAFSMVSVKQPNLNFYF